MKSFFAFCISILFFSTSTFAKDATVHITVKNFSGSITVQDPELRNDLTRSKVIALRLDAHQSASYTMVIDKPTYLILYFSSNRLFNYSLFLSPGDELFLTADFTKKNNNVIVTGKGSNNNQPQIFALTNMDLQPFKTDKQPERVIAAINKQCLLNKSILANYIKVNKPSSAFIKASSINLQYFVPMTYYEFNHNNNFGKPKEQLHKWQKIQDSIFSTIKLSNDGALIAYNYTHLIDNFVPREVGNLWVEYKSNPALFFKEWFHSSLAQGNKSFDHAQAGILSQKVIDKYFTGKAAEYTYGQTIKYEFSKADYQSVAWLSDHFKKKYPASVYVKGFSGPIAEVVNKQNQALSSKTIFVKDNGTKLNSFNDVLALTKGKAALIDMWGTWCSPCRKEIEKEAPIVRASFKGKNVNFIYIDNKDIGREKEWKKQIAYYQIEGVHILANSKLTEDIMGRVKSTSYPTYIIIKKDGSYKQITPKDVQSMIKEIDAADLL